MAKRPLTNCVFERNLADQKSSFSENWICRSVLAVLVTTPKFRSPNVLSGRANTTELLEIKSVRPEFQIESFFYREPPC